MKSALYPAERNAALGIAFAASGIAVLPTPWRLCAVTLLAAVPAVAWMTSSPTAWLGWFLGAVLLLPPLPASISDTGAHPAVAVAAVGFYAALLFARRWTFAKSRILTATAALALLMTASVSMALIHSGVAVAAGSAVRALLFALGPFLFLYIVCGPGQSFAGLGSRPARLLFAAGVLSAVFACIDFFYQFPAPAGYSPQFIWLADRVLRRAQGMFYDAGALGNMCAFFLVMATAAIIAPGRVVNRWIAALGALPLGAALVFSYSRAAVLNLVVAVSAMLWLRRREVKWLRTALATAVAIAVAALVLGSLAPGFAMLWLDRARKTVDLALSANGAALSGRVLSWQKIASFIADHPVRTLLGVGYKTLPYSDVLGRPVIADNTYLSTFIETGIGGLAALCAMHAAILRETYQAARSLNPTTAFYGLWAFSFWIGEMVQMGAADLLTYWRLLPVFFFVIGIAVLRAREQSV